MTIFDTITYLRKAKDMITKKVLIFASRFHSHMISLQGRFYNLSLYINYLNYRILVSVLHDTLYTYKGRSRMSKSHSSSRIRHLTLLYQSSDITPHARVISDLTYKSTLHSD